MNTSKNVLVINLMMGDLMRLPCFGKRIIPVRKSTDHTEITFRDYLTGKKSTLFEKILKCQYPFTLNRPLLVIKA